MIICCSSFVTWSTNNMLTINNSKTKHVSFGSSAFSFAIDDLPVVSVKTISDLGITFTCNLSWSQHISAKTTKCYRLLHTSKRCIPFNTPSQIKLDMYKASILPVLLHGSQVWFADVSALRTMERLNKYCLRWVFGSGDYSVLLSRHSCLPVCYLIIYHDLSLFIDIWYVTLTWI